MFQSFSAILPLHAGVDRPGDEAEKQTSGFFKTLSVKTADCHGRIAGQFPDVQNGRAFLTSRPEPRFLPCGRCGRINSFSRRLRRISPVSLSKMDFRRSRSVIFRKDFVLPEFGNCAFQRKRVGFGIHDVGKQGSMKTPEASAAGRRKSARCVGYRVGRFGKSMENPQRRERRVWLLLTAPEAFRRKKCSETES